MFSLISSGTETMKVREAAKNLLGKARARPEQVQQVIESVHQVGLMATYQKVMNRLDRLTPLGYSSAGVVWEVGEGSNELTIGDRVACAGAEYAHHAVFIFVPKSLCVAIPHGITSQEAAFTTVGAVALQGMRQGDV
ncbi:MAG: oxidoreductase, partial [Deltaproteobacteria bacterium]|nr:oxidoreductase [Deltaproteobacteria bacterium]